MPHKIVVHLHAIEALAHLVTKDGRAKLEQLFDSSQDVIVKTAFVDYHKPGPELAQAIHQALEKNPSANVILLKNHGIVVGADSIDAVQEILKSINAECASGNSQTSTTQYFSAVTSEAKGGYIPFPDSEVQALALDSDLYKRLGSDWALYPDHAVFLGPKAFTFSSWEHFLSRKDVLSGPPELIFIENVGVFIGPNFNLSKTAQLRCYYDVISRIQPSTILDPLSDGDIKALLNWDAEKLRQQISK